MKSPTLSELPPPPSGKTGWPWTEESPLLPEQMPDGFQWPRISIVTPSYNQGQFIEETIRSVLLQGYPNLEYTIIDGGSTDNSVEIISKYEPYLAFWVSEPDRGQSHAINKGFERCSGDYLAWMNADDCYMPGALDRVFMQSKGDNFEFIYGCTYSGNSLENKQLKDRDGTREFSLKHLLLAFRGEKYVIPSQSVFISKNLFQKVGLLDEDLYYCMDMDWFMRMALEHPLTLRTAEPICFYRLHPGTKTGSNHGRNREEAIQLAQKYSPYLSAIERIKLSRLIEYSNTLEKYRRKTKEKSIPNFLKTIIEFPLESLLDRFFLGMVKQEIICKLQSNQ